MGTRADFYVGRGEQAEWLGSIAWDGYPSGHPNLLFDATDEADYRRRLGIIAKNCARHWTSPDQGWPWPWEDSRTTDYAYAWDDGKVWFSCFGGPWHDEGPWNDDGDSPTDDDPVDEEGGYLKVATFPNMKDRMNVQFGGARSGLIVIGPTGIVESD